MFRQSVVAALASKKATHAAPHQPPSLMAVANGLHSAVDTVQFLVVCSKALKFLLFVNVVNMQMSHFISDHFSGPGRAVIQVSVCVCVSVDSNF